jgi:hypothetical protein
MQGFLSLQARLSLDDDGAPGNTAVSIVAAGGVGESFAIFEYAADANDVTQTTDMTLLATYAMNNNSTLSVNYKLFETAQQAIDNTSTGLATSSGVIADIASAVTGTFSTAATAQAKVVNGFKDFDGAGDTAADLNVITAADLDGTGPFVFPATVTSFDDTDLVTGAATVTFSGNFSFGEFTYGTATWGYDEDGVFTATNATENTDGTVETAYAAGTFSVDLTDVDAVVDAALKGSYTAVLEGVTTGVTAPVTAVGAFSEASGTITYDTTSVTVPYLSTFSDLNQKVYLVNSSSVAASYTTSFTTEAGITASAGTKATGTIPANSMMTIKATDLVVLTGGTRTAATIEVEAVGTAIVATTQVVNKSTGGTDTVSLAVSNKF